MDQVPGISFSYESSKTICSGINHLASSTGLPPRKVPAPRTDRTQDQLRFHLLENKTEPSPTVYFLHSGFQHILFCRPLVCIFEDKHHIDSYSVQLVSFCDSFLCSGPHFGGSSSSSRWVQEVPRLLKKTTTLQPLASFQGIPFAQWQVSVLRSEDGSLQSAALGPVSRKHCDPEEVVLFLYWRQELEDPVPLCLMMGTPAVSQVKR